MKLPLHFSRLAVRRMYDVPQDGLHLSNLCAGVNIVYGPNAAGKTTLARALQTVLWPTIDGLGHPEVEGHFTLDGAPWRVDVQGQRAKYQRDGFDSPAPDFQEADKRDYYHLHLHVLLQDASVGSRFAQTIVRAAHGDFDVAAARDALGFKEVRPRSSNATTTVASAKKRLIDEKSRQRALETDRQKLGDLRREREASRAAGAEAEVLSLALAYHRAAKASDEAKQAFSAFPEALARIRGDEVQALEEARARLDRAQAEHEQASERIATARSVLAASILPEDGIQVGLIDSLQKQVQQLEQAEQAVETATKELTNARKRAEEAWRQIEGGGDPQKAAGIDVVGIGSLIRLVQEAEEIRARQRAIDAMQRLFGDARMPEDLDRLRDGTRLLLQWLASEQASTGTDLGQDGKITLGITIVLALAGIVLGLLLNPLYFLLLLPSMPLFYVYARLAKSRPRPVEQEVHRRNFEELHLDGPALWEPEAVRERLSGMYREFAERRVEEARASKWNEISVGRDDIERRHAALRAVREELAAQLGLAPEVSEEQLFLFLEHLLRWQQACADAASREAELQSEHARVHRLLASIGIPLAIFGLDQVESAADAHGKVNALSRAEVDFRQEQGRLGQAEIDLERAGREEAEAEKQVAVIFERFGLDLDDDAGLRDLCRQCERYEEAKTEQSKAEAVLANEKARLVAHPRCIPALFDLLEKELESQKADCEVRAGEEADLSHQISKIEQRIEDAEQGHDFEEAKAAHEEALDALSQECERDYRKIVGWRLAEYLRNKTRDQQLPEVFHRARDLFVAISRGRYKLLLNENYSAFEAFDNVQKRGLKLEELSSGTRVQLLLAVRMAFVECQERDCMLPLVLDETLANSDDERALAIIEAVLEIAATGRQVFYLTAQQDEVAKWHRAAANRDDVALRVATLNGIPIPGKIDPEARPTVLALDTLPAPDGFDHAAYGARLGVPAWDAHQPVTRLPLWYLIEDPTRLFRLLSSGIRQWGALNELGESGTLSLADLDGPAYRRATALAHALHAWREAWQVGRGRPVNKYVLLRSGAVSEAFIDRVDELCQEVGRDGGALLRALREGRITRFHASKVDELEAYLTEHGYVTDVEPLSDEEALGRAFTSVCDAVARGEVAMDDLQRFFGRIHAGPPRQIAA